MTEAQLIAQRCHHKDVELSAYYRKNKEVVDRYLELVEQRSHLARMISDALLRESKPGNLKTDTP